MNNQGFLFAVIQYFTVEDKPRLYRRNTWFDDHKLSSESANYFWIGFTILAMAIIIVWSLGGLL